MDNEKLTGLELAATLVPISVVAVLGTGAAVIVGCYIRKNKEKLLHKMHTFRKNITSTNDVSSTLELPTVDKIARFGDVVNNKTPGLDIETADITPSLGDTGTDNYMQTQMQTVEYMDEFDVEAPAIEMGVNANTIKTFDESDKAYI